MPKLSVCIICKNEQDRIETCLSSVSWADEIVLLDSGSSEWRYSNFNYMVLAAVIEEVSGISYGEFMRQRIFLPLSMNNSFLDQHATIIPGRATGYELNGDVLTNAHYMNTSHFSAAGALMSSADDMAKWHSILNAGEFINPQLLKQAYTPVLLNDGSTASYGFGWNIEKFLGEDIIWHSGSGIGYESSVIQIPSQNNLFVAVMNNSPFVANSTDIARRITAIMLGQPIPIFQPNNASEEELKGLQGSYLLTDGEELQLRILPEVMQYRFANGSWRAFVSGGNDLFYRENSLSYFRLLRDRLQQVTGLTFSYSDQQKITAKKTSDQVQLPPQIMPYNKKVIDSIIGDYDLGAGNLIKVKWSNDQLYLQIGPQQPVLLKASDDFNYFSVVADLTANFEKLVDSRVKINVQERYPYSALKID